MVQYEEQRDGTYICLKCGKSIKSPLGFMAHSAWHRRREPGEQTQLKQEGQWN